ncbi:MAG: peptide-methionine (S)-S-oxide reductase [Gemmatimonadetes bacterium]|nr:peptide-methionine (S)-S-oxide reductase [Gemmatimonadota bacterium]
MNTFKAALGITVVVIGAVYLTTAISARRGDAPALPAPTFDAKPAAATSDTAVLAGGCFWGVSEVFKHVKGVSSVVSGYAGGTVNAPTYGVVSTGMTGHAESVQIAYDPSKVSYGTLLKVFFAIAHDPTTLNRQGPDHGTQYRSAIFVRSADQQKIAESYVAQLTTAHAFKDPIVTQIAPLPAFYRAEEYHQDYFTKNRYTPYIVINDAPKVAALEKTMPTLWRP